MSLTAAETKIFHASVLSELKKSGVFLSLVNTDYEGEIKAGGAIVQIPSIGAMSTSSYTPGSSITFSEIDAGSQSLEVDQEDYVAFKMDDVHRHRTGKRSAAYWVAAGREAAQAIQDDMEAFIAAKYSGAGLTVTGSNLTSADILGKVSECRKKCRQNNWPSGARWNFVIGANTEQYMLNAKILTDTDNSRALAQGFLGSAYGFDFYSSNNVQDDGGTEPNVTEYNMAFLSTGLTFANAITKLESVRIEDEFADGMKMLNTYGGKIIAANRVLRFDAEFATETSI